MIFRVSKNLCNINTTLLVLDNSISKVLTYESTHGAYCANLMCKRICSGERNLQTHLRSPCSDSHPFLFFWMVVVSKDRRVLYRSVEEGVLWLTSKFLVEGEHSQGSGFWFRQCFVSWLRGSVEKKSKTVSDQCELLNLPKECIIVRIWGAAAKIW